MPKESVYGNPDSGPVIEVRWLKDRDVQLGIRLDPKTDKEIAFVKLFDSNGDEVALVDEGIGYDSLWTDSLTRKQINDLIVVLRRARDNALGKDA